MQSLRKITSRRIIKMKKLLRFLKDEEGVTAIKYGLIASMIAIVIVGAVGLAGTSLNVLFKTVSEELEKKDMLYRVLVNQIRE